MVFCYAKAGTGQYYPILCEQHARCLDYEYEYDPSALLLVLCTNWASARQNLQYNIRPVWPPSMAKNLVYHFLDSPEAVEDTITKTRLFKYTENF